MNCPKCGNPEQARVRVCPSCGMAYASQDLLELRQLEFLLQTTASWPGTEDLRQHYSGRLEALRARLLPPEPGPEVIGAAQPAAKPVQIAPVPAAVPARPEPAPAVTAPRPAPPPKPKAEAVPFDQWLLSERNIKFALYTGGLLLVIAGLIFVGANWARIPGPVKFAILLAITAGMYLGGALLYKRPSLRLGGVALLAIASGFFLLDFAVLQIYVFRDLGLDDRVMWLICSLVALPVYFLTAFRTRATLFTYLSIAAAASAVTAGLALLNFPWAAYLLVYAVLAIGLLLAAHAVRPRQFADFTYFPLWIVSQIAAPLLYLTSFVLWVDPGLVPGTASPWLALAAMLASTLFYLINDRIYHWIYALWAAAGLFFLTSLCMLIELNIYAAAILIILMFLAAAYMLAGYAVQRKTTRLEQALPLLFISHAAVPLIFLASLLLWASPDLIPQAGSPWFALTAMLVVVLFYVLTDLLFHWILARWAAAFAFAASTLCILVQLDFSLAASSFTFLILALTFLLVGWLVRRTTHQLNQALPLYIAGYAVAVFATLQVGFTFEQNLQLLAQVLIGDVILLVVSAVLHRRVAWAYGAAWLFIAPVAIYAQVYLDQNFQIGLALFSLMVAYAAAGYIVGRRYRSLAGAFLSAAAFLSLVVVPLVWTNSLAASLILGASAALYLLFAVWLGWVWLLVPVLAALHLAVITGLDIFYHPASPWDQALTIAYALLVVVLLLTGIGLRRLNRPLWAWPVLSFAALDVAGTYLFSLVLGGWLPVALSAGYAALAFWLAWAEDQVFATSKLPPMLTYLGVIFTFIGHFYALAYAGMAWTAWPPITAGVCALLVVVSWLFRQGLPGRIYGTPIHRMGLALMLIPLLWIALVTNTEVHHMFTPLESSIQWPYSLIQLITFAIASCVYFADGAIRRNPLLGYLGGGALVVAIWSGLMYYQVSELQAYVLPLGLGLVLVGWNERRIGRLESYRWATLFGLLLLMGSAFYQSFEAPVYAALLLVESVLALGLGIRIHSRGYVIVGGLALVANALVQFGPAFIELDRWIQIGVIGSLLLGGGLLALFRRDQIITTRRRFTEDWKKWQP